MTTRRPHRKTQDEILKDKGYIVVLVHMVTPNENATFKVVCSDSQEYQALLQAVVDGTPAQGTRFALSNDVAAGQIVSVRPVFPEDVVPWRDQGRYARLDEQTIDPAEEVDPRTRAQAILDEVRTLRAATPDITSDEE